MEKETQYNTIQAMFQSPKGLKATVTQNRSGYHDQHNKYNAIHINDDIPKPGYGLNKPMKTYIEQSRSSGAIFDNNLQNMYEKETE